MSNRVRNVEIDRMSCQKLGTMSVRKREIYVWDALLKV